MVMYGVYNTETLEKPINMVHPIYNCYVGQYGGKSFKNLVYLVLVV